MDKDRKTIKGIFVGLIVLLAIFMSFLFLGIDNESETESKEIVVKDSENLDAVSGDVVYHENVEGYLAKPSGDGLFPGLILIHEWWGLNDNIKETADRYAENGYVALAVDLYGGKSTEDANIARSLATLVSQDMDKAFANLEGAVSYLESHPNVQSEKLASVGWCFGGGWSYQMAKNDLGIDSSVIYYGRFNPADDLSKMRANIMGHFGEDDAGIKVDDVREFEATLNTLAGDHQIFIYPNSGHAFANEGGASYVEESSELAWERTLEFLGRELG